MSLLCCRIRQIRRPEGTFRLGRRIMAWKFFDGPEPTSREHSSQRGHRQCRVIQDRHVPQRHRSQGQGGHTRRQLVMPRWWTPVANCWWSWSLQE